MVWIHAMPHQNGPANMTKERWIRKGLSSTKFHGYALEDAPNGIQKPNMANFGQPTIKHMHFDGNGVDFVFSNCLSCCKKDFLAPSKAPINGKVPMEYKDAPRLGRCGCVVCTKCYLAKKLGCKENDEWIPCPSPSCNDQEWAHSHHRDEVIWIMNEAVIESLSPS
jgi:hypothetical protein